MKTKASQFHILAVSLVSLSLMAVHQSSAQNLWDGGDANNSNWGSEDNWDNDAVPTSPAPLTFDGTTRLDPFNDLTGFQVNGFTFAAGAGAFVIDGNDITLNGGIQNLNTNTQTIDLNMALSGSSTRSIRLSSGAVTLNGDISGPGELATVGSSDSGTLTLNGNNSYSGGFFYWSNSSTNKTVNLGHANALGTGLFRWQLGNTANSSLDNTSGSAMTIANDVSLIGQGVMRFVGSDDLTFSADITNESGDSNDLRRVRINAGSVTFGGNLFLADASTDGFVFQLSGAGNLTIEGVVSNYTGVGGTAGGFRHEGVGTLTLSNAANTYTGATVFSNKAATPGVIEITKLADGGQASSIGDCSNAAENLGTASKDSEGILRYIGSGDSTDRLFSLDSSENVFTIESSGTGALHFTNNMGSTTTGGSGNKFVELGGTYTGSANTMAVNLTQTVGEGTLFLRKVGAGTWELTNTNDYSGGTTVNGGTLLVSGTGSINSSNTIAVNNSGSSFEYTSSVGLDRNVNVDTGGAFVHSGLTNYSGNLTWTDGTLGGTNWEGSELSGLTVNANRTISPGNSPGTASTGDQTWGENGSYLWEINDATGTSGSDPGWDLLSGTGDLTLSSTTTDQFTILVTSLTSLNVAGDAANFNQSTNYQWMIADFANPIAGFSSDIFTIDTANFTNTTAPGSMFAVVLGDDPSVTGGDNTEVFLTYTIPEPGTVGLALLAGSLLLLRRRRK